MPLTQFLSVVSLYFIFTKSPLKPSCATYKISFTKQNMMSLKVVDDIQSILGTIKALGKRIGGLETELNHSRHRIEELESLNRQLEGRLESAIERTTENLANINENVAILRGTILDCNMSDDSQYEEEPEEMYRLMKY